MASLGSGDLEAAMTSDRTRRLRYRSLLAVGAVLAALLSSCTAEAGGGTAEAGGGTAEAGGDAPISVMTQNLYVGAPLNDAFAASSWAELVAAGTSSWATLLGSDFPTRAGALADEIAQARPHVVGLQEVTLWRDQSPSDVQTQPAPNATQVAFDFLAILRDALSARGIPYAAVATSTNVDVELAREDPGGGLVDVRLTDRDVLLVRSDVADRVTLPGNGHYTAQFSEPFLTGPVTSTRGWTSIDYRLDATTTTRIFNTHLEVSDPQTGTTQELQGEEFLALVAASPHPVIALGDFNSPADGSSTPTYRNLTAVLPDAWTSARPADPGLTCCQPPLLDDAVGREYTRIDLVLAPEDWRVAGVERTVDQPFRAAPAPLWASDHFGVIAQLVGPGG
jgi:endonuclease/exonuclease/phosphatase family metal-dependent hydrolase